jgi:hypothetical protein
MITKFYDFINESIRDKMTPKSSSEIKRINKRPIQNKQDEYRWLFAWKEGGGNDVWAKDKREAKKLAFQMGLPTWMPNNEYANKTLNDIKEEFGLKGYRYLKNKYPDIKDDQPGWSQGLHVNLNSMHKETLGNKGEHDSALDMLSR